MAISYHKTLPDNTLTQGETLVLNLCADPAASITVNFAGPGSQVLAGIADSAGKLKLSAATATWTPGEYLWEATQVRTAAPYAGQTARIERQRFTILPAISSITAGTDIRTTAEIAVAMLEASLSGSATAEVSLYRINNRELRRYSIPERIQLLSFWRREVQRQYRIARGTSSLGARLQTRI